jgi:predicted metal-dependent phosphoesterase TrpH
MSEQPLIRADLHLHTTYSADAAIPPKIIVDQLYTHPFINAVAITDHNTIEGYRKIRELASAYTDILIIPGVEISAIGGDLLVLGVEEMPPRPWKIENIIDFAQEREGLVIAAHPYRAYGLGDLAKKYEVDAIEVLNGASPSHINKMAEILAREMGVPGVAGSDAHYMNELWSVYTEIQASSDVDEILKAIKRGAVRADYASEKSIHF